MSQSIGDSLRELGDDQGRPFPASGEEMLGAAKRVRTRRRGIALATGVALFAGLAFTGTAVGVFDRKPDEITFATVVEQAQRATDPQPGPGQYLHVRMSGMTTHSVNDLDYGVTETTDLWVPADHSLAWTMRERRGAPFHFPSAEVERAARSADTPLSYDITSRGLPGPYSDQALETPSFNLLVGDYPRDPAALLQRLRSTEQGGTTTSGTDTYSSLFGLMLSPDADAGFRAVILRAMAMLPGEIKTQESAHVGSKEGLAISREERGLDLALTILLDPDNSAILAYRIDSLDNSTLFGEKGYNLSTMVYNREIVDSAASIPTPSTSPYNQPFTTESPRLS